MPSPEALVIFVEFVQHGRLTGFRNDKGFCCARRDDETEEQCRARASDLVRQHAAPEAAGAIVLLADYEH